MTIEPMTIDAIKAEVAKIDWRFALEPGAHSYQQARRWMTWAHSEARARMYRYDIAHFECSLDDCCEHDGDGEAWHGSLNWGVTDWLAEVLREIGFKLDACMIGWPENQSE